MIVTLIQFHSNLVYIFVIAITGFKIQSIVKGLDVDIDDCLSSSPFYTFH